MQRRLIAMMLCFAMIFTVLPAGASAEKAAFSDMPSDWSTEALEKAVENGLLNGADGKIMPKDKLTRAQMATIINRAFGAEEVSVLTDFDDVVATDWYFIEMAKAVAMETFQGSGGKLNPNDPITREQAFAVIARALKLSPSNEAPVGFIDLDEISSWARGEVHSLLISGYIQGSGGYLNPQGYITRAEFAQVMDNIIKQYIRESGEYTIDIAGNVIINTPGVTLKDSTITGDLIIGEGVGEGDVNLENVVVRGRLLLRGGGEQSIVIRGDSVIGSITLAKIDGVERVYIEEEEEPVKEEEERTSRRPSSGSSGSSPVPEDPETSTPPSLVSVFGITDTSPVGSGEAPESPITWEINVVYEVNKLEISDIQVEAGATAGIYSDSSFGLNSIATIPLTEGEGTVAYIKVMSQDFPARYYAVTINRGIRQEFAGGTGTEEDPFLIETAEHLDNIRNYLGSEHSNKHFIQIADIDLGVSPWNQGDGWVPIGTSYTNRFRGAFDGNNKTISGLTINRSNQDYVGLFGVTSHEISIAGVNLVDVDVNGGNYVGALIGSTSGGTIVDIQITGVVTGHTIVGGLIGYSGSGEINNSHTVCDVSGNSYIGGLVGIVKYVGTIENTSSSGNINATGNIIGGLVGVNNGWIINNSSATGDVKGMDDVGGLVGTNARNINESYASGKVEGRKFVGGLVGSNRYMNNDNPSISNSYASGSVIGEDNGIGGFVGYQESGTISDSYALGSVEGNNSVGGFIGATDSAIDTSFSVGDVRGNSYVGGFVGSGNDPSAISNSYSVSSVDGNANVGGFGGQTGGPITNAYAAGLVSGNATVGGFIGSNYSMISSSYWDTNASGQSSAVGGGAATNIVGKSSGEMQRENTFTGWEFNSIWNINEGQSYPYLQWQDNENIPYPPEVIGGTPAAYFAFNADTGTITGYHQRGIEDNLPEILNPEIPPSIDGVEVKHIGDWSFANLELTSVTFPNLPITIGSSAFRNNLIEELTIPDDVITIGEHAFENNKIKDLSIESGISHIANWAFRTNELVTLTLPDTVEIIGTAAFGNNQLTSLTIGNGVTTIHQAAFYQNKLIALTIPDAVETIGRGAFQNNQLTSVTFGNSVSSIGQEGFRGNSLTIVNLPHDNIVIKQNAFSDNSITSVILGNAVTFDERHPFIRNNLSEITIGSGAVFNHDEVLTTNTNFKDAYQSGGAGTYTGTQTGTWTKIDLSEITPTSGSFDVTYPSGTTLLNITSLVDKNGIDVLSEFIQDEGLIFTIQLIQNAEPYTEMTLTKDGASINLNDPKEADGLLSGAYTLTITDGNTLWNVAITAID